VRSLERSVLARSVICRAVVVGAGVASSARARAVQRCAVCAASSRARAVGAAASVLQGLRTCRFAPAAESQRERPYRQSTLAQGQHRWRTHECPRERGQARLGAERAARENEGMSQCLGASSAAGAKGSASRSGQQYRPVQTALPNPSIERTPYGTLRVPPVAAHVER
jgi:hypothetical protein